MSVRLCKGTPIAFRAVVAAGCITALLLAVVLSAIPRLHEQVHTASSAANHECAVTLLASGNYQHTISPAISVAPPASPTVFAHNFTNFSLVSAHLEFSLLEHAPPAKS
jgi:predicted metal-binding membrane protein